MSCVLRLTCYVLCFARYVNVTSQSNTRARMVVTQHHLSPSAHIRYNHKEHPEVKSNGFFSIRLLLSDVWFDIIFMFILHKDSLFPGHSYQPGLQCLRDMKWPCAWGSRQWLPRVTLRLPWALDFRAFSPVRWNEWCTPVNRMAQGSLAYV